MDMPGLINSGYFGNYYPSAPPMMQYPQQYAPYPMNVTPFQPQMYNSPLSNVYDASLPIGYNPQGEAIFYRPQYRDYIPTATLNPLPDGTPVAYHDRENVNYVVDVPTVFQQAFYQQQQAPQMPETTVNVGGEGYVFQPVVQNYTNPYQRKDDYYNPFPHLNPPQQYNGYRPFGVYSPFMSMDRQQRMMQAQIDMGKVKVKMMLGMVGKSDEYDDEKADKLLNPYNVEYMKTSEQMENDALWTETEKIHWATTQPPLGLSPDQYNAQIIQQYWRNYHEAFDHRTLCQFFNEDMPKLMREFWIAENIDKNNGRNRAKDYRRDDYSELLGLHNFLSPFAKMLLDTSRYDNNTVHKQADIGLELAEKAKEYASKRLSEIRMVPPSQYLNTPEAKENRRLFTESLLDQIYQRSIQRKPDKPQDSIPITPSPAPPLGPPSGDGSQVLDELAKAGIKPFEWKHKRE